MNVLTRFLLLRIIRGIYFRKLISMIRVFKNEDVHLENYFCYENDCKLPLQCRWTCLLWMSAEIRGSKELKRRLNKFCQSKNDQHLDFPGGHPPEYYPNLTLLNFADRTGCGETT